ncbi:hypothetical protein ACFMJW_21260, partial [Acinetobacter baumannii]
LPNVAEFYIVFFALLKAGVVVLNALYSHRQYELNAFIKQIQPKLLIGSRQHEVFSNNQFIDLQKLHLALQRLYKEHPILRLSLSADGIANIMSEKTQQILEVDDFSKLSDYQIEQMLMQKREQWTHQKLDLSQGQTAR